MRLLGELKEERLARLFHSYLIQKQIENDIRKEESAFEIWIHSEDDIENAGPLFEEFVSDPENEKYQAAVKEARKIEREKEKKERTRAPIRDGRLVMFQAGQTSPALLTLALIAMSVLIAAISRFGSQMGPLSKLYITVQMFQTGFPEIGRGEVWRLITPIFIHFGPMHLVFNIMWLYDLGAMIEGRKGTFFFLAFVVFVGISSNLCQFYVSGPRFGGMSGVVYGLLGYAWMTGKFNPRSGIGLHKTTVVMMLAWYFLCYFSVVPIANAAHTAGLVLGTLIGLATSAKKKDLRLLFRNKKERIFIIAFSLFIISQIVYHLFFSNIFAR